jgi:hypothetical protein
MNLGFVEQRSKREWFVVRFSAVVVPLRHARKSALKRSTTNLTLSQKNHRLRRKTCGVSRKKAADSSRLAGAGMIKAAERVIQAAAYFTKAVERVVPPAAYSKKAAAGAAKSTAFPA